MLSKEKFVEKWRLHIAALALYGITSDRNDGPFTRAAKIWDIPKQAEDLLRELHESLLPECPSKLAAWVVAKAGEYTSASEKEMFQGHIRKSFPVPERKLTTEEHVEAIGKAFKTMTEPEQKKLTDLIRKVIATGK